MVAAGQDSWQLFMHFVLRFNVNDETAPSCLHQLAKDWKRNNGASVFNHFFFSAFDRSSKYNTKRIYDWLASSDAELMAPKPRIHQQRFYFGGKLQRSI